MIAVDTTLTDSSRRADVVLAAAGFSEVAGTTTNFEGRITTVAQAVTPPGTARPDWLIASELAVRLGRDFGYSSASDIWAEIERVSSAHHGITADALASPEAADGIIVAAGSVAFEAPAPADQPAVDAYSLALVADRTLYDQGTLVRTAEAISVLSGPSVLRLNSSDAQRLGVPDGGRVRVTANDRSFVVDSVVSAAIPAGVAAMALNQAEAGPTTVIDATAAVTEVRLEAES